MLSKFSRRFAGLVLALILISGPLNRAWAQSLSFSDTATQDAVQLKRVAMQVPQSPQRRRCSVKRRMLTGAAVGFLSGVVAVRKAAEANDGTVGVKTKLHAGGYGAALGAFIGLATCRP